MNVDAVRDYFTDLQERIVAALEALDGGRSAATPGRAPRAAAACRG